VGLRPNNINIKFRLGGKLGRGGWGRKDHARRYVCMGGGVGRKMRGELANMLAGKKTGI